VAKISSVARRFEDVLNLLKTNNEFFGSIPKAKTAKIVRNILALVGEVPDSLLVQSRLCDDVIEWCKAEKRTFLRQRIEAKVGFLCIIVVVVVVIVIHFR
jgi:26S proteasome regulatory subunit N6